MKIGILTFHSQLNYGGVLQCWALQQFLRGQGHEVVVLDHWMFPNNSLLWEWLTHLTKRKLVRHLLLLLTCRGYAGRTMRILRTIRFIRRIGLTPYHFNRWSEAPKDLGVDCIVVGSDQVWHWGDGVFPDPAPYLLDGAPQIPAISYAASFGMNALPPESLPIYAEAFRRFTAISVREFNAVGIVAAAGAKATHVLDPTLLLDRIYWKKFFGCRKERDLVVCYFTRSFDVEKYANQLDLWAKKNNCRVELLVSGMQYGHYWKTAFAGIKGRCLKYVKSLMGLKRVTVCMGYGPKEFVRAFMRASSCVTDSFHALMFSYIGDVNIRIVSPSHYQKDGMGRFDWFVREAVNGKVYAGDLQNALESLVKDGAVTYDKNKVEQMAKESRRWLMSTLKPLIHSDGINKKGCL